MANMDEESLGTTDQSARVGGKAAGGTAPRPGDPDTPAEARQRARKSNQAMREQGFGDHKGSIAD